MNERDKTDSDTGGAPVKRRAKEPTGKDKTVTFVAGEFVRYQQFISQRLSKQLATLLVIDGTPADVGRHVTVELEAVLGRDEGSLRLRDSRCSRRHAAVTREGAGYVVRDVGSTNGTYLNGVLLEGAQPLKDGDWIMLGQTAVKFNIVDGAQADYLARVEDLVTKDELTGLPAKHTFDASLEEAMRAAGATGSPLGALMMDMDGLKKINDRHGHHVGANTISEVGMLIGRVVGDRGEACRFGGDEFSAFLPRTDLEGALAVAEEIRREVEGLIVTFEGVEVKATISIGVAELPPDVSTPSALLARADRALYRAKEQGRNCVSI